jgi:hypothetical protein
MGNELNIDEQLQADWLDAKLRDEMPYIDDAGFTARVVQQLPQRRHAPRSLRAVILLAMTFLASALAFVFASPSVAAAGAFLFAVPLTTLCILTGCIVMTLTLVGGSFALSKARDPR